MGESIGEAENEGGDGGDDSGTEAGNDEAVIKKKGVICWTGRLGMASK